MPISKKLINLFEKSKVKYEVIKHRTVFTAYDKAQTLKVPEKILGKTLVINFDLRGEAGKKFGLVLIPANKNLAKEKFRKLAKAKKIDFVKEIWMKKNLKGVKVGAVPPFGNLWGLPTFVDRALLNQSKIIANSGDYNFSIRLNPKVLKKAIPDLVAGNFSQPKPRSRILTCSARKRNKK
jgi:Ala-tRNA(Pro) deacylase